MLIITEKFIKQGGWEKSPAPLLKVSVNISAQWLIGFNSPVDCWSYAGVGVKQSGDRLFQLNNWKYELVDELFYEWLSSFTLPSQLIQKNWSSRTSLSIVE
ncbi:hypothetical protein HO929_04205 [Streptococcus suis]|nr:hypothetical protein [Streptococcus suis]